MRWVNCVDITPCGLLCCDLHDTGDRDDGEIRSLNQKFRRDSQDESGNKMVNEYVRESKIGSGRYGKVVNLHLES
ncbi:serine/threonine-protein kinase GRIK2-like [Actinidia eriantha]|uniref:serine/threonine-protein kinase GRIK2-like n=1 Tax=Actinidia eriantha TaxID=165200 RepID=UPI002587F7A2|nr:serine/threonine-protein kinase GRIK2-like [Actinidia eriantha]